VSHSKIIQIRCSSHTIYKHHRNNASKLFVNFVAELGGGGEDAHDRKERSVGRLSVGVRKKKITDQPCCSDFPLLDDSRYDAGLDHDKHRFCSEMLNVIRCFTLLFH
jgi:hypothetical protein